VIFRFDIEPQAKQSVKSGKGRFYTDNKKKVYVNELKRRAKILYTGEMLEGPLKISRLVFAFTPPKRLNKAEREHIDKGGTLWKSTKPDFDNLEKPLLDALEGIAYKNDSQICRKDNLLKIWSKTPFIEIVIENIKQ
jgi:Holliday junction resolvase RusA-like endonuclease